LPHSEETRTTLPSSAVGGPYNGKSLKELEAIGEKLFAKLNVNKEADPLQAARAIPYEKIMETRNALLKEFPQEGTVDNSAVDGWFLQDKPQGVFQAGKQNAAPLIIMANLSELIGTYGFLMPGLMLEYANMVSGQIIAGSKIYAAIFDQVPTM
jgi:carboxylesterase type B